MLREYSHTKSESLAQIRTTVAEIQHFFHGIVFNWRTLYVHNDVAAGCSGAVSRYEDATTKLLPWNLAHIRLLLPLRVCYTTV